jgi:polyhydroxybutyrate depolymerase
MWMRFFKAILLILILSFLPACVVNDTPDPPTERPDVTVNYRESGNFSQSLTHDNLERTYLLYVPPKSDIEKKIPLIVVLHGATGDAQSMVDWDALNLNEKADQHNFAVVYPDGTGDIENRSLYWNAAHCCGTAFTNQIDDIGFIRTLIETLIDELNLDSEQVFVTGFSNGGMMAYRLAAEMPDLVAAAAPVAGTIGGKSTADSDIDIIPDPAAPVPIIVFHGALDLEVPYYGGHIKGAYGRIDISVFESVAFWVLHNSCVDAPIVTHSPDDLYSKMVFIPIEGSGGAPVVLYSMWQEAHVWPKIVGHSSATDIILEFFLNPDSRIR